MSQARRMWCFAQSGRRGEERRASLKMPHTRRCDFKAPVLHATIVYLITSSLGKDIIVLEEAWKMSLICTKKSVPTLP